jgi:hypothetical protein
MSRATGALHTPWLQRLPPASPAGPIAENRFGRRDSLIMSAIYPGDRQRNVT